MPENPGCPDHESTPETTNETGTSVIDADNSAARGDQVVVIATGLTADGKLHVLPHGLTEQVHLPEDVEIIEPRFRCYSHSYLL